MAHPNAGVQMQTQFSSVSPDEVGIGGSVVEQAVGSGTHPAIAVMVPNATQTMHNVTFFNSDSCCAVNPERKYFRVLENGYEANYPFGACYPLDCGAGYATTGDPGVGCFMFDNCFCPYMDHVHKHYFDRGIYDQRGPCRSIGCIRGDARTFGGEIKYQCCRKPCCDCCNSCMNCYIESCCGERIRYNPCETYCCCCGTTTTCSDSCFCLFGPIEGQPKILMPFISCLGAGESKKLEEKLETARAEWKVRTGIQS